MIQIDYGLDIEAIDQLQEPIVSLYHQDPHTLEWVTTLLFESEAFQFQRRLDLLNLDYLPLV